MKKNKVFIISLHKTGTTSLSKLFEQMGYLVTGPDTHLFMPALENDYKEIDRFLENYDVFQDDPWYMIYPYLQNKFPDSKFVFLERNESSWINSVQSFYGRDKYNNAIRRMFYGHADTLSHKELNIEKYRLHNQEVKDYFKTFDNFISITISNNKDVVRLQEFLEEPIVFKSFPHRNKTPKTNIEKRSKKIKHLVYGGFGIKGISKKFLYKILGKEYFLQLRTEIRLFKSRSKLFLKRLTK